MFMNSEPKSLQSFLSLTNRYVPSNVPALALPDIDAWQTHTRTADVQTRCLLVQNKHVLAKSHKSKQNQHGWFGVFSIRATHSVLDKKALYKYWKRTRISAWVNVIVTVVVVVGGGGGGDRSLPCAACCCKSVC